MKSTFTLNTKVYNFQGIQNNTESWGYTTSGAFTGRSLLVHQNQANVNNGASHRQNWRLVVPVLIGEDSPCGCAGSVNYENTLSLTLHRNNKATTTDLQDILDQLDDLIADTDFRAAFVSGNYLS